jgi:hypothetical protein
MSALADQSLKRPPLLGAQPNDLIVDRNFRRVPGNVE